MDVFCFLQSENRYNLYLVHFQIIYPSVAFVVDDKRKEMPDVDKGLIFLL